MGTFSDRGRPNFIVLSIQTQARDGPHSLSLYSRHIFPRICDFALDRPFVAKHRKELLSLVSGSILEIGFGTGLNLPHYPHDVRQITAIDPNPGMQARAKQRIQQSGVNVDKRLVGSEQLPFDNAAFDCVVSTFTLCSVGDVQQALAEVVRVLKPGGRFFLMEHGLSPDPGVQKWQRRMNWLERLLADNCHLNRNIRELVGQQPFDAVELEEFYLEKTPPTHGYIYRGVAVK